MDFDPVTRLKRAARVERLPLVDFDQAFQNLLPGDLGRAAQQSADDLHQLPGRHGHRGVNGALKFGSRQGTGLGKLSDWERNASRIAAIWQAEQVRAGDAYPV